MSYNICLFLSDLLSMIVSRSIHLAQIALFYKSRAHEQCVEIWFQCLGQKDPLEEAMSTHSRILAWRVP